MYENFLVTTHATESRDGQNSTERQNRRRNAEIKTGKQTNYPISMHVQLGI